MTRPFLLAVAVALFAVAAVAKPVEPALRDEAMALYARWNKAILDGKLKDGLALRTEKIREQINKEARNAAGEKKVLGMLRDMVPDGVEVLHASSNAAGDKIEIIAIATKIMPAGVKTPGAPPAGSKLKSEVTLAFARERGAWKYDQITWGMDPDKVKPCASEAFEGMASFEETDNSTMGGQIRRVKFADDHTMVAIRMFDEEACIFLPSRARLKELGFNADLLQPWVIIEIGAWPHKSDKQRVWAESLRIQSED